MTTSPRSSARYARAVAERYPWVEDYTPVNEPLTTARFSCLYGHWHPHARDTLSFARAVLNQCRGVVLSMRAVREVNSSARLVQTEDLGQTYSTRPLSYQADFENERRWLTWDLLAGRVARGHAMWDYLVWLGVAEGELEWFAENPCPPDIVGVNHYVTSERFLDERLSRYPASTHGGNGRHAYADVEAVRARADGVAGPRALLREAWERYRLPVAVTEAHLGCTREEQMRWLKEVWDGACDLRRGGRGRARRDRVVRARRVRLGQSADAEPWPLRAGGLRPARPFAATDGARTDAQGTRGGARVRPPGARLAGVVAQARTPLAPCARGRGPQGRREGRAPAFDSRQDGHARAGVRARVRGARTFLRHHTRAARWTSPMRRRSRRRSCARSRGRW